MYIKYKIYSTKIVSGKILEAFLLQISRKIKPTIKYFIQKCDTVSRECKRKRR